MSLSRNTRDKSKEPVEVEVIQAPTVAIIDDDEALSRAVGRVLRANYHCVVNGYSSVEEFLSAVDKNPKSRAPVGDVDLILLDFHLPGKDGPKLVGELKKRKSPLLQKAAIMGITGDDQRVVYNEFKNAGIEEILHKPLRALDYRHIAERAYKMWSGGVPPEIERTFDRII